MSDSTPSLCPIATAAEVIFARWTTDVLWALVHSGTLRFGALKVRVPAATSKMLAQRLRQLERDGLVVRTAYAEMPPRVEYTATPLAKTLVPIFAALEEWSGEHGHEVDRARRSYAGPLVS